MLQTYAFEIATAMPLFERMQRAIACLALKLHEFCVRQTLFVQFLSQVLPYVRTASFVLGVGITVRGFAQAPAPTEDTLDLREVVISAARWKQTAEHIPSQVAVVLPKLIAQFQPQTAADLLSLTGKVFIQKSQQGGGSPMIRGFATNRLIYSVDGVRMNTAIFRAGNIQNVIVACYSFWFSHVAISHLKALDFFINHFFGYFYFVKSKRSVVKFCNLKIWF